MAFVASLAAAADTLAQAPTLGTRRHTMLQAERALPAAARTWGAAALLHRERDATGRSPGKPPGIWEQRWAPLEGAGEIIHETAVTVLQPHARQRPQARGPRVAAVRRRRISCNVTSWRAAKYGRAKIPAQMRSPRGWSQQQCPSWAPPSSALATRWRYASFTALRRTWPGSPSGRCVPAASGSERPGAPAPRRPHSPGPALLRGHPLAPAPGLAPVPT